MRLTLERLVFVRRRLSSTGRFALTAFALAVAVAFAGCPRLPELAPFALVAVGLGAVLAGRGAGLAAALAAGLAAYLAHPPYGSSGAIAASITVFVAGAVLAWIFGAPVEADHEWPDPAAIVSRCLPAARSARASRR